MNDARIIVDGGTRITNPGRMYSAFKLLVHTTNDGETTKYIGPRIMVELDSYGDNNQAEFLAAMKGIETLIKYLISNDANPEDYSLHIMSDSKNFVEQASGRHRLRSKRHRYILKRVVNTANEFRFWYFRWVPRKVIVKELGC